MKVERFAINPIIVPQMDARMGENVNGPSLIRVPDWVANPLARYYLYSGFADRPANLIPGRFGVGGMLSWVKQSSLE